MVCKISGWSGVSGRELLQQCFCKEQHGEAACFQLPLSDLPPVSLFLRGGKNAEFLWKVTEERYTVLLARDFAYWKQIIMFCYSVSFKRIIQAKNPWQPLYEGRGQF